MRKHLKRNRLSHLAYGETFPTEKQRENQLISQAQHTGLTWGKLLDRWHDEGRIYHALESNGSPLCGAKYFSSTGEYPFPPTRISQCCKRCINIVSRPTGRRR